MLLALRLLLTLLGVAAIGIAGSIMALGAEATAGVSEEIFRRATAYEGPGSGHWSPTMDSELRFYAALWGAYGILLVMTANDLRRHITRVPWLAAVFFAGGVGRLISHVQLGPPHPFFQILMLTELSLPIAIVILWARVRNSQRLVG